MCLRVMFKIALGIENRMQRAELEADAFHTSQRPGWPPVSYLDRSHHLLHVTACQSASALVD
jgi:hypothetical protein